MVLIKHTKLFQAFTWPLLVLTFALFLLSFFSFLKKSAHICWLKFVPLRFYLDVSLIASFDNILSFSQVFYIQFDIILKRIKYSKNFKALNSPHSN